MVPHAGLREPRKGSSLPHTFAEEYYDPIVDGLSVNRDRQLHTHSFTVTGALAADVLPVLSTALTVNVFSHTPIKV